MNQLNQIDGYRDILITAATMILSLALHCGRICHRWRSNRFAKMMMKLQWAKPLYTYPNAFALPVVASIRD